mgnify:CR=1 FL=1
MADFGGWLMPIEYPGAGVLAEHTAVRERVGLFDVSHLGKASVKGAGALEFLNTQVTNDLNRITDGQAQYTMLCNPDGGVVDDLIRDLVVANKPKTAELRFVIKDQGVVIFEVARSGGDWLMTIDHDHWVGPKLGAEYNKAMISESWKAPNADQGLFHGRAEQAKLAALICNQLSKVQKLTPQDVVNVMVTVSGRNYSDS